MTGLFWMRLVILTFNVADAVILLHLIKKFLSPKEGLLYRIIRVVVALMVVALPVFVGDTINIIGILPVFFAVVLLAYSDGWFEKLSIGMIFFAITMSLNAFLDTFFICWPTKVFKYVFLKVEGNFLELLLYCLLMTLCRKQIPKLTETISGQMWLQFDMVAVLPFLSVIAIVAGSAEDRSINGAAVLILPCAVITSIGLLFSVVGMVRQQQLMRRRELWDFSQEYYRHLETTQIQLRSFRHDIINHLQTMAALDDDAMRKYCISLLNSPSLAAQKKFCKNQVFNVVLSAKMPRIEQLGIDLQCQIALDNKLQIDDADLCTILANSLDNAIEACEKNQPEDRKIIIKAQAQKGLFSFSVQNPTGGETSWQSRKKDRENHGFGMKNIANTVFKYGGNTQFGVYNGNFRVLISIPLGTQDKTIK